MKQKKLIVLALIAAGYTALTVEPARAYPSFLDWAKGAYQGGRAIQEGARNNPFGAVDRLLRFPTPTNPFRYLPGHMKDGIQRDLRKIDPAHRYGPEYRDLFR